MAAEKEFQKAVPVQGLCVRVECSFFAIGFIVHLKQMECGIYGDLIIIYLKPYSIYLRGMAGLRVSSSSSSSSSNMGQGHVQVHCYHVGTIEGGLR